MRPAVEAGRTWAVTLVNGGLVVFRLQRMAGDFAGAGASPAHAPLSSSARCCAARCSSSCATAANTPSSTISHFPADGGFPDAAAQVRPIHDIGTISLLVTIARIVGALAIWWDRARHEGGFPVRTPTAFWIAPDKARADCRRAE